MYSDSKEKTLHEFTWTIENFRACTLKRDVALSSPVFMAENLDRTTWFLKLYPKGEIRAKEFMSLFLYRSDNCAGPEKVECEYTLEAIDSENKSLAKFELAYKFKKNKGFGIIDILKIDSTLKTSSSYDTFVVKVSMRKRLPKMFTENSACTKIVTDQFSFKWNVKNFVSSKADINPVSFSEALLFEIIIEIPEDDVKISMRRKKGFTDSQILLCSVALLDKKGQNSCSKQTIFDANTPDEIDTWKFPNFLKRSKILIEKDKYMDGDYFTLKFKFAFSNGKTSESVENIVAKNKCRLLLRTKEGNASMTLKENLKYVFDNKIHTDVELRVGEVVIRAHKVILCARSPVFSAMFDQDMAENQTGAIRIDDVEAGTLNSLLEFMYIGDREILDYESALKLLLVADKYQVLTLKEQCSSSLESFMCDKNVCDILFTADLVQQSTLKFCAVNHIKEHSKMIFKSDEWKQLAERSLKLATETFCEVSTLSG